MFTSGLCVTDSGKAHARQRRLRPPRARRSVGTAPKIVVSLNGPSPAPIGLAYTTVLASSKLSPIHTDSSENAGQCQRIGGRGSPIAVVMATSTWTRLPKEAIPHTVQRRGLGSALLGRGNLYAVASTIPRHEITLRHACLPHGRVDRRLR